MAGLTIEEKIIQSSSPAFWEATKLLPNQQRLDFVALYSFVRVTDDYVDQPQPDTNNFLDIYSKWQTGRIVAKTTNLNQKVSNNMLRLIKKYDFDKLWIEAFLSSMSSDVKGRTFDKLEDSLEYVYGSAEVIGLMLAKIMGLPPEALPFAQMQGRAWQWLNFIRDIEEDRKLGRCYFPLEDLKKFNLNGLTPSTIKQNPTAFKEFVQFQINRYRKWSRVAKLGYKYIPATSRQAILMSAKKYDRLAALINQNPLLIIEKASPKPMQLSQASAHR